ncbi:MAG: ABC transporter ATP-binding protein [Sphingopyxis sp.]|uniref:ABC transporter ATP-binding protein n=1 Tax=Sphingopyxis sp. TaxID=1908224 RepID=UPI002ABC5106|nr:ABC transporter ATP-binding protein [Sphingopyxis sp.]MDZ3831656.1 ABC transporter ATP-binding protein [Sphingopyxis sp.]
MAEPLILSGLTVREGRLSLIEGIHATITPGRLTAIVGPNGAGKSTLLRAIARIVRAEGRVTFGGTDMASLSPIARARCMAYLPQTHELAWDISVGDMVALGRFAYGAVPGKLAPEDRQAIDDAMTRTGCAPWRDRGVASLSGGEQALACLARVLAAQTPVLLVDEPVAALDPANQYRVMECLAACADAGRTVIAVLHDLSLVAQFADEILWLQNGHIVAQGAATPEAFARHVPALFTRTPTLATDGSDALYFRRTAKN